MSNFGTPVNGTFAFVSGFGVAIAVGNPDPTTGITPISVSIDTTQFVPPPVPAFVPVRINCGGPAVAPYSADMDFAGGNVYASPTALITNPTTAPTAVFATERYGNFAYIITGCPAGQPRTVNLYFAEVYWAKAGQRQFNVAFNGIGALMGFDILTHTTPFAGISAQSAPIMPDGNGTIIIGFSSIINNAKVSAVEVL